MSSTQHYHFTLFESSDKPTWLTDWNNTISAIDTALYNIASGGGDLPDLTEVVARLQALEGRVDSDELRLNQVEGNIVDILADIQTLESDLSALGERVTDAEGDIADLETEVNINIPGQIQAINTSISEILTNYTALDGRVTALEQAGGGGGTQSIHGLYYVGRNVSNLELKKDDILVIASGQSIPNSNLYPLTSGYLNDTTNLLQFNNYIIFNYSPIQDSSNRFYYVKNDTTITGTISGYCLVYKRFEFLALKLFGSISGSAINLLNRKGYMIFFGDGPFRNDFSTINKEITQLVDSVLYTCFSPFTPAGYTTSYPKVCAGLIIHPNFSCSSGLNFLTNGSYTFYSSPFIV